MSTQQSTCVPQQIELFLTQQLSEAEQFAFEKHLDACSLCQERLQFQAAAPEICNVLRESFSEPALLGFDGGESDSPVDEGFSLSHQAVLDSLTPSEDPRMLGRLGNYEVMGVVGVGGMAVVLKALDVVLDRYVAIKVLAPHLAHGGSARNRFAREARAAAAVVHPHVIEIYGVAEDSGLPYLVMSYIAGRSLERQISDHGPLELEEILRVGMQASQGLAAAHGQGLVHRDVKPANILLSSDGVQRVQLTDFGLARAADDASLTKTGIISGTPQYMSPEQASGRSIDQRSDLFSLGSVLYAMCTGRPPFRAETSYGVLRRITDEQPRSIQEINPRIPEWLCNLIARLMQKRPDDRFNDATEVAELLEACLAHVQQPTAVPLPEFLEPIASEPVAPPQPKTLGGVRRGIAAGAVAIALLGMAAYGFVFAQPGSPPDIAGYWTGSGWGTVTLEQLQPGKYKGTYTDTFHPAPGFIELKWSPEDRQYYGNWGEKDGARSGKLSARIVNSDLIRGAWTASKKSTINPGSPRLTDLTWTRLGKDIEPPGVNETEGLMGVWQMESIVSGKNAEHRLPKTWQIAIDAWTLTMIKPDEDPEKYLYRYLGGGRLKLVASGTDDTNAIMARFRRDGATLDLAFGYGEVVPRGVDAGTAQEQVTYIKLKRIGPMPDPKDLKIGSATIRETQPPEETSRRKLPLSAKQQNPGPAKLSEITVGTSTSKLAFSPDGQLLAGQMDNESIGLINGTTGQILSQINLAMPKGTDNLRDNYITAVEFSPDGKMLAIGTSLGRLMVVEVPTGVVVKEFDDGKGRSEIETPKPYRSMKRAMGAVRSLAFSPDGRSLACCGTSFRDTPLEKRTIMSTRRTLNASGRLRVWDVESGEMKHDLDGHTNHINDVAFSPDGHLLASVGRWESVTEAGSGAILWNPSTGSRIRRIATNDNGATRSVAFSNDGRYIVIGSQNFDNSEPRNSSRGAVCLAQTGSGIKRWLLTVPVLAYDVAVRPGTGEVFVACGNRKLQVLDQATGEVIWEMDSGKHGSFAIAPDGSRVAMAKEGAGNRSSIEIWKLPKGEEDQ